MVWILIKSLGMKSQKADVNRLMESIESEKPNKAVHTKPKQENMSTSTSLNSSEETQLNKGEIPEMAINNKEI